MWGQVSESGTITGIFNKRDIVQRERRYPPIAYLQLAVLPGKPTRCPQFGAIHRLHQECTRLIHSKQPAQRTQKITPLAQGIFYLRQQLYILLHLRALMGIQRQRIKREQVGLTLDIVYIRQDRINGRPEQRQVSSSDQGRLSCKQ